MLTLQNFRYDFKWGFAPMWLVEAWSLRDFTWYKNLVQTEIDDVMHDISWLYRTRAIITRSWILAKHKDRIFWKNLLENKEMVFKIGVKNVQAAAYNGAHTVIRKFCACHQFFSLTGQEQIWTSLSRSLEIDTESYNLWYPNPSVLCMVIW